MSQHLPMFSLPAELLRDIFGYTDPTEQDEILVLMSVCSTWRQTILGITALFTFADWDVWPVGLLRLWCQRAGHAGLEVVLSPEGIHRAVVDADYTSLVGETNARWRELCLEFDRSDGSGNAGDVHRLLSRCKCDRLHTLILSQLDHEGLNDIFNLPHDFAPDLEELMLKDAHVIRGTPWENLKRVSVNVDFWARGVEGRNIFRTLSRTEKLVFNGCSFSGVGDSSSLLGGLNEVVIVDSSITGFAEWPLRHLSFPHATKLVLRGMRPYVSEFPEQDKVLWNNAFPELASLTLQLMYPWFHMVLPLLSRGTRNDETLWFPSLTTLCLYAHDWKDTSSVPRASQQIETALINFFGTHDQHHRNALPMERLTIKGIALSEGTERQLRSLVKNLDIQPDSFEGSAGTWND